MGWKEGGSLFISAALFLGILVLILLVIIF